jgi:hypothetical protein
MSNADLAGTIAVLVVFVALTVAFALAAVEKGGPR